MSGFESIALYGGNVREEAGNDGGRHFHVENESGTGDIAVYPVFDGIELVYNDMHMSGCGHSRSSSGQIIEVNHCRQGRYECSYDRQSCCYVEPGDMSISAAQASKQEAGFPLGLYQGIMITIDLKKITAELYAVMELLTIMPARIEALVRERECLVIRANERVDHVFAELYTVREQVKYGYIKVKVLELLLLLTDLEPGEQQCRPYFAKAQTDAVKSVHDFLLEHIGEHYTLEELAGRFGLSATMMKACFKGVYGTSVYAYLRTCRFQLAQKLLKDGESTVAEIAARIGYENPNKFSTAFKKEYGISPTEYRKRVQKDRNLPG